MIVKLESNGSPDGIYVDLMEETPLPTLMSRALLQFARDYRRSGEGISHPSSPTLLFWSNVLRYLSRDGLLLSDAPKAARLSRRMVKPLLGGFERAGGIVIEPGSGRGKKRVRLTPAGAAVKQAWTPLVDLVTDSWRDRLGVAKIQQMTEALERLVGQLDLEHPHFPLGYGAVDDSVTGGAARPGVAGPPFIPPHGTDWVPVVRAESDSVTTLPLSALLSQALTEFAMQLELGGDVSLSEASMVRWLPATGAPAREVAARWGDNFKLKAAIERRNIMQISGETVTLTGKGRRLKDTHVRAIAAVETSWRDSFGGEVVDDLRRALESIADDVDDDLPDHPMVSWVGGIRVVGVDD